MEWKSAAFYSSPSEDSGSSDGEYQKAGCYLHDGRRMRIRHLCDLCDVYCCTLVDFSEHLRGKKHKKHVQDNFPDLKVEDMDRLHFFLDNYMKQYPLLGLENIVEEQMNSTSYRYTCQLCNASGLQTFMIEHITSVDHVERYIERNHKDLSLKVYSYPERDDYIEALAAISFIIIEKYGRRKIQLKVYQKQAEKEREASPSLQVFGSEEDSSDITCAVSMDLMSRVCCPSLPDGPCSFLREDQKACFYLHDKIWTRLRRTCDLCNVYCSKLVDFIKHILGKNHRKNVLDTSPDLVKEDMDRLQYLLDNYMKQYPLLGLEYIVEEQLDSTAYSYTCQLCNVSGRQIFMIEHITFVDHVERYIEKDHKDLSLKVYSYPKRDDYIEALAAVSFLIIEKYGRPNIQVKESDVKVQSPSKTTVQSDRREGGVSAVSRHSDTLGSTTTQCCSPSAKKTKT